MTKVNKISESANDSLTFSTSANEKGITTKEIARITGKKHSHVLRDVRERLVIDDGVAFFIGLILMRNNNTRPDKYYILSMNALSILNQWYKNDLLGKLCGQKVLAASNRFENSFGEILINVLNEFNIEVIKQFTVNEYRIDFYIPKLNIAIEYDEAQHEQIRNILKDKQREECIKSVLGCEFIRLSFKDSDATNVGKVLKQIVKIK